MHSNTIKPKYIVDENGKKLSVILTIAEFYELLEDLHDLKIAAEQNNGKINVARTINFDTH